MNILIEAGWNKHITVSPEHTAALVALLPHLRMVEESGYGETQIYQIENLPPRMTFIESEKLGALSEKEQALKKALDAKSSQWSDLYFENDKLKKRVSELELGPPEAA